MNSLITALLNVVLNYILIPIYGINGAAIATLTANIIFLISVVIYSFILIKVQPIKLYFIKSLISGFISIMIMKYIYNLLPNKLIILLITSFIMLIIYWGLLFIFKYFNKEDFELFNIFKQKLSKMFNK